MNLLTLLILSVLLFTLPLSTVEAAKPSRRELIEQGQELQQRAIDQKIQNTQTAADIPYIVKTIPLLNFGFEYPGDDAKGDPTWKSLNFHDNVSGYSERKIADGDYIVLEENRYPEIYNIFMSSKDYPTLTTIDTVRSEWANLKDQPDHDNVYEYSNMAYIRELNVIREDDYTFLGKPALYIEFTFNNWSKFWTETVVMFPHGKKVYTIKYRRERDEEDRQSHVFEHVLDTFHFLTSEPSYSSFNDVSANHKHARAIERLKDLKIVGGYSDGSFKPEATINRAEFVKILTSEPLVNATELATCDVSTLSFSDVPAGVWYEKHLCVAVERGMIAGYPDGTFGGEKPILFAEAAKIVAQFFAVEDIEADPQVWFRPFIRFLAAKHAIPTGISSASMPLSRSVMTEIIYRLYDGITSESSLSEADFK